MTMMTEPTRLRSFKLLMLGGVSLSMMSASAVVHAQDVPEQVPVEQVPAVADDEVVVTGTRRVIQDSIALKRAETTVVDGLSSEEIGGIPSLSIAEALETITSVAAEREGSGATQVSIRGLGPFLGSTVINGREATAGSGNRSINFSQFPSELFNKIAVHKTQSAELIEGGVAGQIALSTLKPLEFGKRRVQLQAKGSIQPDNLRIRGGEQDIGYRLTGSYVDQWESSIGEFGLSVGGQIQRRSNSEQEARASTTNPVACRTSLIALDSGESCDQGDDGDAVFSFIPDPLASDAENDLALAEAQTDFITNTANRSAEIINPVTGQPFGISDPLFNAAEAGVDLPFVITSSNRAFRQNITDDSRDSIFAAAQWRPNDRLDINIDGQYSLRNRIEFRNDLIVDARGILGPNGSTDPDPDDATFDNTIFDLSIDEDGNIRSATTEGDVQINNLINDFEDEYFGIGANVSYDVTDRLNITIDASRSDTNRRTAESQARVITENNEIISGLLVPDDGPQQIVFVDFDVNDPTNFNGTSGSSDLRVREDLDAFRDHTVTAIKADLAYELDHDIFSVLKAGGRFSVLDYEETPEIRRESTLSPETPPVADISIQELAETCANESFPEPDFFDGEVDGNLITNITSTTDDGSIDINDPSTFEVLEAGTGNTFLTFGGDCLITTALGRDIQTPTLDDISGVEQSGQVFVEEETIALYAQADFNTEFKGFPVRGNVGVRYVDTTVTTDAFRAPLNIVLNEAGEIVAFGGVGVDEDSEGAVESPAVGVDEFTFVNGYSEFLPSFNVAVDVHPDVVVRGGVFRALSRPDPGDLGAGRDFSFSVDDDIDLADLSPSELVSNVTANGNADLEPLTSWNFDAAVEWYPNEDSIFALGLYYKRFIGGFEVVQQTETFTINTVESLLADSLNVLETETVDVAVELLNTNEDSSEIFGLEFTGAHSFTYLPGIFSGLGVKASYNFATSDFEFEDGQFGEATVLSTDGDIISLREGFVSPANLPGLSKHTANVQAFWKIGRGTLTGIGKYRSDFFQQSNSAPTIVRFIDDALIFDARYSYNINKNLKLSIEGTNLFNSPREQQIPTLGGVGQFSVFGPRYLVGVTARF